MLQQCEATRTKLQTIGFNNQNSASAGHAASGATPQEVDQCRCSGNTGLNDCAAYVPPEFAALVPVITNAYNNGGHLPLPPST
jgi:hypothetical protein